jgi:hypothetical protein
MDRKRLLFNPFFFPLMCAFVVLSASLIVTVCGYLVVWARLASDSRITAGYALVIIALARTVLFFVFFGCLFSGDEKERRKQKVLLCARVPY